ncbi:chromate transporter [Lacticaseibacillus suihuaensis]
MIWSMIWAYLKIGFLGFGGGYAMLSLIYAESTKLGLTAAQFADLNALDGLIPGPVAINSATYIGQLAGGFWVALAVTLTVCIPSLVFVPLYMRNEQRIQENWALNALLRGIKPASAGLIVAVAVQLALTTIGGIDSVFALAAAHVDWVSLAVLGVVLVLDLKWRVNPVVLIALAGVIGAVGYWCGG